MRKLLVLFLVLGMASLGMASVASAAIVIDVDPLGGNTKFDVVIEAGGSLLGYELLVEIVGDAEMSDPTITKIGEGAWAGPTADYSTLPGSFIVSAGAIEMFGGLPISGPEVILSVPIMEVTYPYTINVSANSAAGTVLDGEALTGLIDSATVVPEPMTMTLLGLGGLALIRRRR